MKLLNTSIIVYACGHPRQYMGHFSDDDRALLERQLCAGCIAGTIPAGYTRAGKSYGGLMSDSVWRED